MNICFEESGAPFNSLIKKESFSHRIETPKPRVAIFKQFLCKPRGFLCKFVLTSSAKGSNKRLGGESMADDRGEAR